MESGLVDRAAFLPTWSVTLDGATVVSQRAVITFLEPNGTYSFTIGSIPGYVASVAYGEVVVSDWNPTVYVTFEPIGPNMHLVTFGETTLPPGFAWSVTLNGTTLWGGTGASSRLTFPELNGTYGFTVGPVAGWSSHPSEGSLNVAGNDVTQVIAFTRG